MTEKKKLQIHFSKTGDLRWISHRDLARVWERLLRRANVEMAFSEGFHPKPKISFPSALALGVEALDEIVEIDVLDQADILVIADRIRCQMPVGMELLSLEENQSKGKTKVIGAEYQVRVPEELLANLEQRVPVVLGEGRIEVEREKRTVILDLSDPVFAMRTEGADFYFAIPHEAQGSLRPSEFLEHMRIGQLLTDGTVLRRMRVLVAGQEPKPESKDLSGEKESAQTDLKAS